MKRKKLQKWILGMMIVVCFVIFSTHSLADVGNINRYHSSSGSSSSSSSHSYSSSNRYSSGSRGSSSGSTSNGPISIIVAFFVIGGIIVIVTNQKNKNPIATTNMKATNLVNRSKEIGDEIRKEDPAFSEEKFLSWAKMVFLKLQSAWTKRDWKEIRPFESNELFEMHRGQLQEYINQNRINVVERISINEAEIMERRIEGDKEILVVYLKAVMKDYIIDATTQKVLEGNKNTDWYMNYQLTFARKLGVKTQMGTSNKSTTNCPNCGAPTEITSAGKCEYCGSVITTGEHDFVLTDLKGIQ